MTSDPDTIITLDEDDLEDVGLTSWSTDPMWSSTMAVEPEDVLTLTILNGDLDVFASQLHDDEVTPIMDEVIEIRRNLGQELDELEKVLILEGIRLEKSEGEPSKDKENNSNNNNNNNNEKKKRHKAFKFTKTLKVVN